MSHVDPSGRPHDRTVISVRGLGKRYWLRGEHPPTFQDALLQLLKGATSKPFWALRDVSFDIGAGESVALVGANGAGKTTLLRLLCGVGRPTTGSVKVSGRVSALLELGVGFHPQLTGRENLYVSAIVGGGLRRYEVDRIFDDIVEFAELSEFIDQPLRTYSLGMQMRLGFAVAIHVDPAVLIVDEVLSVGDRHFQQKCLERIHRFRQRGKTMLMVSHDTALVRTFCSRVLWMRRGHLLGDGPTDVLLPRFEAAIQQEHLSTR